jgi:dienelactone hydrolase
LITGFKQMTAGLPPRLQALILSYSHAVERAEVPVERINGPILLVSGLEDRVWPSSTMADLVIKRLKEHGVQRTSEHLSFADAGHIINFPFLPTATRIQLGGTVEGLARADAESWKRVLTFLATSLRQPEAHR